MTGVVNNFKIQDKILSNNIFYAPLAGYTDYPFRKVCFGHKPGLIFCEMVKIEALVRYDTNSYRLLDYDETMHPIGAQLCGSNIKLVKEAVKILEDLGFDWIDLNCGCPVDKVTKDGSGSGMLKTPLLIGEMVTEMKAVTNLPISVKIRSGWDESNLNFLEIVKIVEEANAQVLTIHGRTRSQGYSGRSNWDVIKKAKESTNNLKIFGNGDLFSSKDILELFEYSKCDGVMLARGMLKKPWLCKGVINGNDFAMNPVDVKSEMLKHFNYILDYQIEKKAVLDMRRVSCWYLQNFEGVKKLKIAINNFQTTKEIVGIIENYDWDGIKYKDEM